MSSGLVVPRVDRYVNGKRPTALDMVNAFLTHMRAQVREATTFTPAGRTVIRRPGERILVAPNGEKLRVVEIPGPGASGGNQVEHGDHLHASVRPEVVTHHTPISVAQARRLLNVHHDGS